MRRRDFLACISAWLGAPLAAVFARDGGPQLRLTTFCCDVTPPLGTPIYSSYKPLATIEHPLLAKGVVIDDGKRRCVLCAVDWCELCNSGHRMFRSKLAKAVGTDVSHVAVQTVHQHTAPMGDLDALNLLEQIKDPPPHPDPKFFDAVTDRLAATAKQSIEKLQPFDRIGTGQAKVDRVASSRRIINEHGKCRWRGSNTKGRPELRELPEGLIDPMLKTITFACGDKPLVRLHYYATHPQSFYGDPRASYDFPGIAREKLQEKEGIFQIYFTGCAGDIAAGKYNDASRRARDELAERLLAGMEASAASTQLEPVGRPQWRTAPLLLAPRTNAGYTAADSRAIMENPKKGPVLRIFFGAMRLAFHLRSKRPIELSVLQIGNVHILHLPGEPMIEFQLFAQRSLPDSFVAVAGYGDCDPSYICTKSAFSEGGYEPGASWTTPDSEATLKAAIGRLFGCK